MWVVVFGLWVVICIVYILKRGIRGKKRLRWIEGGSGVGYGRKED